MTEDGRLDWGNALDVAELPQEWVLRQLADADLDDDQAVAELLRNHGIIGKPYFDPQMVPPDARAHLGSDGATIEDARWWLRTARALAGVWRQWARSEDARLAWVDEGFVTSFGEDADTTWDSLTGGLPFIFVNALNLGLEQFRVRAEIPLAVSVAGAQSNLGALEVGLYTAACQQVFNLLVEGQTARRCENETCGRTFVHQLGGAKFRQHRRVGLRFCTPECARAEASRQYRRRKAAQRKEKP